MSHDDLVEKLIAQGYVPLPTRGKVWIEKYRDQPLRFDGSAPEPDITRAAFRENRNAGVSVTAPYIRGTPLKLIGIDVDVHDPAECERMLLRVARIIGKPCPFKVGKKGGTFFCTFEGEIKLKTAYMNRHGADSKPSWLREGKVIAPFPKKPGEKEQGIDLIGQGPYYHSVLPPSIHPDTKKPYQWLPFPGTKVTLRLEDLKPNQLPSLSAAQFMLLAICMQPKMEKIWEFLGATNPGDFNDRMRDGTLALYHEMFTTSEIMELALREAGRDPPDEDTLGQREASIRGTVLPLEKKFPEKKSSSRRRAPRTPPDRMQADWMAEELGAEDCAMFNGEPYKWNNQHWERVAQDDHPQPLAAWYNKIRGAFDDANHGSIQAAMKMVLTSLPVRRPSQAHDLIPFSNGILHIPTMKLRPEVRDDNFVGHLPHQFIPDAKCPNWEIFIQDLTRPPPTSSTDPADHIRATNLVEEYLGYCLTRSYRHRHMLLLIGKTSTGKSVLTKVLKGLFPREWVSEVSLESFGTPNSLKRMVNSLVNVSSETGRANFTKSVDEILLRVTSSEPVEVKTLYQDSFDVALPSRLIINGNFMPDFHDASGAMERRMLLIRTTDVIPDPPILEFDKILLEEAQGILVRLVSAYGRLLSRSKQQFELPSYSAAEAKEATQTANSVSAWLTQACTVVDEMETKNFMANANLYDEYRMWSERNGMKPFSSVQWGKLLTSMGHRTHTVRVGKRVISARNLNVDSPLTNAEY